MSAKAGQEFLLPEEILMSKYEEEIALYGVFIPVFGGIIITLNLVVVISSGLMLKKRQRPRSTYMCLGNVALADMVTGITVVFQLYYPMDLRSHYSCALQVGMIIAAALVSVYSVGLIAVDRYLYIVHGLKYEKWMRVGRVRMMIIATWILGSVIGFLPLMGWYGETHNGRVCWFILLAPPNLVFLIVIMAMGSLVVIILLWAIILHHALKQTNQLQKSDKLYKMGVVQTDDNTLRKFRGKPGTPTSEISHQSLAMQQPKCIFQRLFRRRSANHSKWKAVKVVLFTSGSFIITWTPYFIVSIIYVYSCDDISTDLCKKLQILLASELAILAFLNSLINPIIYAWWHKGFRMFVKRYYHQVVANRAVKKQITSGSKSSKISSESGQTQTKTETDGQNSKEVFTIS